MTTFTVSLDTHGITTGNGGIRVRDREKFEFTVSATFPYQHPTVSVSHRRWAGTPHVQWGRVLCLYAAPSVEWNPSDGMRGLISRLTLWLQRAAEGTLDPEGQPLHPPVAYTGSGAGLIIVNPDLGDRVPWMNDDSGAAATVYAWCSRAGLRVDVHEWLTETDLLDRILADDFIAIDATGLPYFIAPTLLISDELAFGFEYPDKAAMLADHLETAGISRDELLGTVTLAATANRVITALVGHPEEIREDAPSVLILGAPSRRVAGTTKLAHLASWRFDDLGSRITSLLSRARLGKSVEIKDEVLALTHDWIDFAETKWMKVHENRPEVTRRRDDNTASTWLRGKRVLILGCGALGAPIAEQCVRAGVEALTVADNGSVSPGILLRQPFTDADIGRPKATVLAERLTNIRRDLTVKHVFGNVVSKFLRPNVDPPAFDLVVDATADIGARTALEYARASRRDDWPPVVTALFGHQATRGLVTLSLPGATGAGHDILRRTAIESRSAAHSTWSDVADDFFPDPPRTDMFFPEPGCSAPTFVGSSVQVNALAATLFWEALNILNSTSPAAEVSAMSCTVVRLPGTTPTRAATDRLNWSNDVTVPDQDGAYEIRISQRAITEIRAEARRGARLRGDRVETGGMVLGAFDDATRTVHIDVATGPPPDSDLSELYFGHGVQGSMEALKYNRRNTGDLIGFAGMWHTHPFGRAFPSEIDKAGMASLVSPDGTGRRALMLILGGPITWQSWRDHGESLPDIYAHVVSRRQSTSGGPPVTQPSPPVTKYFRGGYGYAPAEGPPANYWLRLLRRKA
nr:ThiF family adenylyltransferase [Rhodococcus sp. 06-418-1B]